MFLHAEEFDNREGARARYLQITGRLRADRDKDLGCYNLLYEGKHPVVAIMAAEAPPADVLAGRSGRPVELPQAFWETLAQRHDRRRAVGQHQRHHGAALPIEPDERTEEAQNLNERTEEAQNLNERTEAQNVSREPQADPTAIGAGVGRYLPQHPEAAQEYAARPEPRVHPPKGTTREATCPRCGATFQAASHREKYCPACRPEAAREYHRQSKHRRQAPDT